MTDQEMLQQAANEDAALVAKIVSLVKQAKTDKAGAISGALASLPLAEAAIKDSISVVKTGAKTTEFWFNAAIAIIIGAFAALGHPLPEAVAASLAGMAGIYTFARSLVKKSTP